jgi:hypothetical protein
MLFVSKRKRFRIVLKPSSYVLDAYGQKVMIPGITREFTNGRLYEDDPEVINLLLKSPFRPAHFDVAASKEEEADWIAKHPELGPAPMITGGIGTAQAQPAAVAAAQGPLREAAAKEAAQKAPAVVDLEKMLDEKIEAKLSPLIDKISQLMETKAESPKSKKVFTCPVPGCGQIFDSGIAVGEHKRKAHADMIGSVAV